MSTSVPNPPTQNSDASNAASGQRQAQRDRMVKRWVTAVAALLVIAVVFLLIRIQGQVSGVEFAPTHFQLRSFRFFEIPLIHLQITPIERSAQTPSTANYLRLNSLVTTSPGTPNTWHLVSISRGLTGTTAGDASLLADQLELGDPGNEYWRLWSIDHPQHAKILWPIIQQLALRELYILMPPLFEIAQLEQTPGELQTAIDTRLRDQYVSLIQDLRLADRAALADEILQEALLEFPNDPDLATLSSSDPASNP